MSRGPENAFWKRVREAWPGHAQRVEVGSGEADSGTPDVVLSLGGAGGWIELKVWPDEANPQQLVWHEEAIQRGAYAMVLAELPDGSVWLGTAESWNWIVGRRGPGGLVRPPGVLLHQALDVVACALIGNRRQHGVVRRSKKSRSRG